MASLEERLQGRRLRSSLDTLGTALSAAGVPVASAAAIMGHSVEVNHTSYVKARRDAIGREQARSALVELGLGIETQR